MTPRSIVLLGLACICLASLPQQAAAKTRTYYISADEIDWKYGDGNKCFDGLGPDGEDVVPKETIDSMQDASTIGGTYKKAQFRRYSANFKSRMERDNTEKHMGFLGALMRVEAGDTIKVVLRNNLPFDINLSPSGGASWASGDEYTMTAGVTPVTKPGEIRSYSWNVPEDAAPVNPDATKGEQSSRLYIYRSTLDVFAHDNAGLIGPIIVTSKGKANADGSTNGIDQDFLSLFQEVLEEKSPFASANEQAIKTYGNEKRVQNGYVYCNNEAVEANKGDNVRWHVASMGSEESMHNFHWHGNTLMADGRRVDQVSLVGGNTATLDLRTDNTGTWMFHCHVNEHFKGGMVGVYTIKGEETQHNMPGAVREKFIAAEMVDWHYDNSTGLNGCSGAALENDEDASVFLGEPDASKSRIGSTYSKAVFKEYTDNTFTEEVERPQEDAYLGLLGPVLRAQVGDTLKVTFKNKLGAGMPPVSMHPHGVAYSKDAEGAPYNDGTTNRRADDAVAPGDTFTYMWHVTEAAGPGPKDPSSKLWMYHSHTDEVRDTYAGLFGGILVYDKDRSKVVDGQLQPNDVERELVFFFSVIDETSSFLAKYNVEQRLPSKSLEKWMEDEVFLESQLKHALNGWMYCNMPKLNLETNTKYRFHIMGLGSEVDLHSPNLLGGVFESSLQGKTDAVAILAGSMMSLDVMFNAEGSFPFSCRVADHVGAGMLVNLDVAKSSSYSDDVPTDSTERTYYIKAEQVEWDYSPNGFKHGCFAQNLKEDSALWLQTGEYSIGSKRQKLRFVEYTDDSFSTQKSAPAYHGILGPLIAAEVNDTIKVVLKNDIEIDGENINFHLGGGFVELGDTDTNKVVAPGETYTYRWMVPASAGPDSSKEQLSSIPYTYASTVKWGPHQTAGLVGLALVTEKGGLKDDGMTPKDVDVVVPFVLQVMDENGTLEPLLHQSITKAGLTSEGQSAAQWIASVPAENAPDWEESNVMHGINGLMYCNWQVSVNHGDKIRMLLAGFGSEEGIHSPRIIGQVLKVMGSPSQSEMIMPAVSRAADIVASNDGQWPALCDIQDHVYAGMIGTLNVGNARRTSMVSVTMEAKDATMAGSFRTDAEQETATAKRSLLNHDTVHKFIMDAKDAILDASEKAEDATWAVRTKGNTITVDFYLMYPSNTSEQEIADDKAKVSSTSVLKSVQSSGSTLGDYGIDASSFKVADNNGGIVDDDAASALRSSLAALFAALAVLILVA